MPGVPTRIFASRWPRLAIFVAAVVLFVGASAEARPRVLDQIRERGTVICGFNRVAPGFATVGSRGVWSGFDVDFCRALAAATLGNAGAIKPLMLTPAGGTAALHAGEIDILATISPIGLDREATHGIRFPGVLYHEGVGLIVPRAQGVTSARELSGASICVTKGSEDATALADYFSALGIKHEPVLTDRWEEAVSTYASGRCQALCAEVSMLAGLKAKLAKPTDHHLLPETISMMLLGPAIRAGDEAWFEIVRWTIHALVAAEERGITATRVDAMKSSSHPEIRRLLGGENDIGKPLGLAPGWLGDVVKAVGNYGEMFDRNLGRGGALLLDRRLNHMWNKGGLLVAPLLR